MDTRTLHLLDLLKEHYARDPVGMAELTSLERQPAVIRQYEILRENPIVLTIAKECKAYMAEAHTKMTSSDAWNMEEKERIFHLATIRWTEWFLRAMGEAPGNANIAIQKHIETLASRAGILSKD